MSSLFPKLMLTFTTAFSPLSSANFPTEFLDFHEKRITHLKTKAEIDPLTTSMNQRAIGNAPNTINIKLTMPPGFAIPHDADHGWDTQESRPEHYSLLPVSGPVYIVKNDEETYPIISFNIDEKASFAMQLPKTDGASMDEMREMPVGGTPVGSFVTFKPSVVGQTEYPVATVRNSVGFMSKSARAFLGYLPVDPEKLSPDDKKKLSEFYVTVGHDFKEDSPSITVIDKNGNEIRIDASQYQVTGKNGIQPGKPALDFLVLKADPDNPSNLVNKHLSQIQEAITQGGMLYIEGVTPQNRLIRHHVTAGEDITKDLDNAWDQIKNPTKVLSPSRTMSLSMAYNPEARPTTYNDADCNALRLDLFPGQKIKILPATVTGATAYNVTGGEGAVVAVLDGEEDKPIAWGVPGMFAYNSADSSVVGSGSLPTKVGNYHSGCTMYSDAYPAAGVVISKVEGGRTEYIRGEPQKQTGTPSQMDTFSQTYTLSPTYTPQPTDAPPLILPPKASSPPETDRPAGSPVIIDQPATAVPAPGLLYPLKALFKWAAEKMETGEPENAPVASESNKVEAPTIGSFDMNR